MNKILIIGQGELKENMAGPTIRSWELASALSRNFIVNLALEKVTALKPAFKIIDRNHLDIKQSIKDYDVIIGYPFVLKDFPLLKISKVPLVIDLYNVYPLENLSILSQINKNESAEREHGFLLELYSQLLKRGDFFICSNNRQRDFWLGMLMSLGRISPSLYGQHDNLKALIDIVPFGISKDKPFVDKKILKIGNSIREGDKVIIWAGGIYDWLDPLTSIKALENIIQTRPEVKLLFMGIKYPIPTTPGMKLCHQAITYSKNRGLYNKNVFFNDWVAYLERQNYILDADIGITTYPLTSETYFSHRTRILDYIWCRLPMIISEGDLFSGLVKSKQLGLVVKDRDVDGLTQAILRLLDDTMFYQACKKNLEDIVPSFYWEKTIKPLEEFCANPVISESAILIKESSAQRSLGEHFIRLPFYVSRYGIKGVLVRLRARLKLRESIFFLANLYKSICSLAINTLAFLVSLLAVLINDIFILPFIAKNKTIAENLPLADKPGISVVVLNWNGKKFLKYCLDSLLKQTFKDYELIVVDNNSIDGSEEFIKENYPQVKLISNRQKRTFSTQANIGIKQAGHEFIALFNLDAVAHSDWLGQLYKALCDNPQVGFCASKMLFLNEPNIINSAGDCLTITGEAKNIGFGQKDNGKFDKTNYVLSACGGSAIYRRTLLKDVGLLDEDYLSVYEDMDLGIRAQWRGWKCLYAPKAVVYHNVNAISDHASFEHIFNLSKNNTNLLIKNLPLIIWIKYFYIILRRHNRLAVHLALNCSFGGYIKGKMYFLFQLPSMLRKRSIILRSRKISYKQFEGLLSRE